MKKSATFLFASLLSLLCMVRMSPAEEVDMLNNPGVWLSIKLNIPLASQSPIRTEPFFPLSGVVQTNSFRFVTQTPFDPDINFFSVYSNEQVVAQGRLFERPTFDEARTELVLQLISNNMWVGQLAEIYNVRTNSVGDFSVIWTKKDDVTGDKINDLSWIHFVRGAKAISLRGKDGANVNVQPIAETLDGLLKR